MADFLTLCITSAFCMLGLLFLIKLVDRIHRPKFEHVVNGYVYEEIVQKSTFNAHTLADSFGEICSVEDDSYEAIYKNMQFVEYSMEESSEDKTSENQSQNVVFVEDYYSRQEENKTIRPSHIDELEFEVIARHDETIGQNTQPIIITATGLNALEKLEEAINTIVFR